MGRDKTENQMVVAITVTYNRTRTLERCLQALLAQSRPVDKILVVDNRSNEDESRKVRELAEPADLKQG